MAKGSHYQFKSTDIQAHIIGLGIEISPQLLVHQSDASVVAGLQDHSIWSHGRFLAFLCVLADHDDL